jgi:hypothetical protein
MYIEPSPFTQNTKMYWKHQHIDNATCNLIPTAQWKGRFPRVTLICDDSNEQKLEKKRGFKKWMDNPCKFLHGIRKKVESTPKILQRTTPLL